MSDITITISGAGSVINFEVEIIRALLEKEGYKVEVDNRHPWKPNDSFATMEEYLEHRRRLLQDPDYRGYRTQTAKVIAQHLPWGG